MKDLSQVSINEEEKSRLNIKPVFQEAKTPIVIKSPKRAILDENSLGIILDSS